MSSPTPAGPLAKVWAVDGDLTFDQGQPLFTTDLTANRGSRGGARIDTIVLHCTAGFSTQAAVQTLKDPAREASAHLVIPDFGRPGEPSKSVRLVPDDQAAWHCRSLMWQGGLGVNSRSLGVEIVNSALAGDGYSPAQIEELARWCAYWISRYPIRWLVTHAYLDPTRRKDPCDTFPWDALLAQLVANGTPPVDRTAPITLFVDGKQIDSEVQTIDGTNWAPIRPLAAALGRTVTWDPQLRQLRITP